MIFQRRWLLLFLGGAALLFLSYWHPVLRWVALAGAVALAALALVDWFLLPALGELEVQREVDERLALGHPTPVRVLLRYYGKRPVRLELCDTPPQALQSDHPQKPFRLLVAPQKRQAVTYHLHPDKRGDYAFGSIHLLLLGPLGLVGRVAQISAVQVVKVYPGLREISHFNLVAQRRQLQLLGVRRARRHGMGSEFESLRDYVPDDEMRHIDWKATARKGHLITRQYELERSQNILLILDKGRTMWGEVEGAPKIDYAIRAALFLAYTASFFDDRVGLLVFSNRIHTFLPPRRGRSQSYAILEALHSLYADLEEPDYGYAFQFLQARWPRRSLLVCFTDLWDEVSSRHAIEALAAQQPRHLPLAVTLLNSALVQACEQEMQSVDAVYQKVAALEALHQREQAVNLLMQRRVLVVNTPAEKLSVELVNRYLEIKEHMLL